MKSTDRRSLWIWEFPRSFLSRRKYFFFVCLRRNVLNFMEAKGKKISHFCDSKGLFCWGLAAPGMTTPDHSADNGTNIISKSLAEQIRVTVPISWAQKSERQRASLHRPRWENFLSVQKTILTQQADSILINKQLWVWISTFFSMSRKSGSTKWVRSTRFSLFF